MKIAWLGENLVSSGREFYKLEALRRKKLKVRDFFKCNLNFQIMGQSVGSKFSERSEKLKERGSVS